MASQDPKTFLWSNIALLMGTGSPTVDAVQRKTQVGRGTVQRIKEGSTSTGTDTLLAIADAFGVEPWELLQPQLGKQTATLGAYKATSPTLAQALEVLAGSLNQLPDERRELVAQHLQTLARAPDSQMARESLLSALETSPGSRGVPLELSIAGSVQEAQLSVESRDIHPVKTKN